jgi:hypothetical protein
MKICRENQNFFKKSDKTSGAVHAESSVLNIFGSDTRGGESNVAFPWQSFQYLL